MEQILVRRSGMEEDQKIRCTYRKESEANCKKIPDETKSAGHMTVTLINLPRLIKKVGPNVQNISRLLLYFMIGLS